MVTTIILGEIQKNNGDAPGPDQKSNKNILSDKNKKERDFFWLCNKLINLDLIRRLSLKYLWKTDHN